MELDEENSSPTPVSLSGSPRAQTDGEDTGEVVPSVRPIAIPTHPLGFSQGTTRSVLNYDGVGGLRPLHSQYSGQVNSPLSASSSGLDLGSPMALNSPLSRSFGPVPVWADDSVTLKTSYAALSARGGVGGENEDDDENENEDGGDARAFRLARDAPRGLAGLGNLGNTCFMNSALQCLCHTPQLMYAFLSGEYKDDLNTDNPLGLGGKLASAFGGLLSKLWRPGASYVTPKHFKFMLSKFAPQFSGYSQQDSQELLSFLLDGLHEDLNRIKDKPYREEKDADGRPDEEVALEAWDNYRARNDSVVVDTFQGLYKSTLTCPDCGYTSVKFDPFMYLSLPLPSPKRRTFQVTVVDQFGGGDGRGSGSGSGRGDLGARREAVLLAVRIPKAASIGDLVREVSKMYDELLGTSGASGAPEASGDTATGTPAAANAEWALGQWNGKTMDLFLNEGSSVESIPEKPSFVYSYFSSKSYKLYAYRYPKTDSAGGEHAIVPPSAAARPVVVYHKSSVPSVEYGIPSLYFLRREGYTEMPVAKSEEDNHFEVQPDDSLRRALEMLVAASPDRADQTEELAQEQEQEQADGSSMMSIGKDEGEEQGRSEGGSLDTDDGMNLGTPTFRLLYGTPAGYPKSTSYFSSSPPSIGGEDDPSTVFLCAKWTNDAGKDLSVVRGPVFEHPSVKILENQASLPFKATLADCLECFCQPEQLDESDTWYCSKCKDHVRAVKKLDLWYLPPVLVVHLKRFSYSRYSRDKLDTHIDFPLQLDLSGFISRSAQATSKKMKLDLEREEPNKSANASSSFANQDDDPVYDLYAVSNHFGGMGGGHYTAFCQMPDDQGWFDFDDSHVSEVDVGKVQSPAAYVLFYHRRGSDVGLANKALQVADSVVHDHEAKACDSPRGVPLSPKPFSRPLEAIPSSDMLDMDIQAD